MGLARLGVGRCPSQCELASQGDLSKSTAPAYFFGIKLMFVSVMLMFVSVMLMFVGVVNFGQVKKIRFVVVINFQSNSNQFMVILI